MSETQEQTRFRSFAERYLITRSANFEVGKEEEQAWACALQARTIYESINSVSQKYAAPEPEQAPAPSSGRVSGVRGPTRSVPHVSIPPGSSPAIQRMVDTYKDMIRQSAPSSMLQNMAQKISLMIQEEQALIPKHPPSIVADSKQWTG